MKTKPSMNPTSSAADIARGRIVPWVIAAFFVSFMVPLFCFAWIAFHHRPSEVTAHAYEKGVSYNRTLASQASMESLGWQMKLAMEDHTLAATLADKSDKPIKGALVKAWFVRPSQAGMDKAAPMRETAPGRYETTLADPAPGLWQVHVTAEAEGRQFQAARDFSVR